MLLEIAMSRIGRFCSCNLYQSAVSHHRVAALLIVLLCSPFQTGSANQIAFSRNSAAFVAFNRDEYSSWTTTLSMGLPAGTYCLRTVPEYFYCLV